jgi:hypothetical protein
MLPLSLFEISKSATTTIAVIGPFQNVTREMQGGYSGTNLLITQQSPGGILARRVAAFNAALDSSTGDKPIHLTWHTGVAGAATSAPSTPSGGNGTSLIADAVAVAGAADVAVVLLFVGDVSVSEFTDRTDNGLIYAQEQLVEQIAALGNPTALVAIAGHSIALPAECLPKANAKADVSAVLYAFLPSQAGGTAVISTLLGDSSPAGRLPVTFYDRSIVTDRSPFDMSLR